jgi:hypothetical protein
MNGADMPSRATPGASWRAERNGVVKMLLSGKRAKLRAVDVSLLLLQGNIPDLLTPQVVKMFYGPDQETPARSDIALKTGIEPDELPIINLICRSAFVEPRIVDEPIADDEIAIDDVDLYDRLQVYNMCTRGLEVLRNFRLEPFADVAAIPDGQDDGAEAERVGAGEGDMGVAPV